MQPGLADIISRGSMKEGHPALLSLMAIRFVELSINDALIYEHLMVVTSTG